MTTSVTGIIHQTCTLPAAAA